MSVATAGDGSGIHFDVVGTGEPLVLLAGQANSRHWWDPVRADFVARYRTIGIDALGTGHSDAPTAAEYSTPRFAADVIAVLDEIGIERAHVYGTSMGGRVAQWVAIDHPERVGALVLGCTTPGGSAAAVAGQDVIGSLAGPPDRARHALLELMFTPGWREQHPGPYSVLGDEAMSAAARRAHRRASAAHDASRELGRIAAPTLVLHGTDDQFCPVENARLLAEAIPGAELALLPDARHAYFIEQRDDASRRVLDFLAAQPLPNAQQFVL